MIFCIRKLLQVSPLKLNTSQKGLAAHVRFVVLTLLVFLAFVFYPPSSEAKSETHVKRFVKKNGKPVTAYKRKSANNNKLENYGTNGNLNPNNGKVGREDPFAVNVKR